MDIGDTPVSPQPPEDVRDLRDPASVAEAMYRMQRHFLEHSGQHEPLSSIADFVEVAAVDRTDPAYSATIVTAARYQEKMTELAAQGDVSACVVLIEHGWALPMGVDRRVVERARESAGKTEPLE